MLHIVFLYYFSSKSLFKPNFKRILNKRIALEYRSNEVVMNEPYLGMDLLRMAVAYL